MLWLSTLLEEPRATLEEPRATLEPIFSHAQGPGAQLEP
jgi:hypothetical protein